ncbi:hypothetical protein [Actinopolyspora mortivallis]|uniref:hypothetical protein n=1 Tax=Actinopolyspora mortivallis TaxID=33906 RepID=UPI002158FC75|nr:hypothetical protein [Actinopolyspora mortivallis]
MSATGETLGPTPSTSGETPGDQRTALVGPHLPRRREATATVRRRGLDPVPAVLYLTVHMLGILVLAALCASQGKQFPPVLFSWDSDWYLQIAANGYDGVSPTMLDGHGHHHQGTAMAFFPGLPLAIRAVALLPGLDPPRAALLVNLAAGLVCAYGLVRLARLVTGSRRVGLVLVVLFSAAPMSVVLVMPYTEALFCALSVWALVGVLENRWSRAGLCCLAAGLIRPTGVVLIAVVVTAAVVALARGRSGRGPWAACLLAPLGTLAYLGWVAVRTGQPDGYFEIQQRGWSSSFDGGVSTARFVLETLTTDKDTFVTLTAWLVLCAVVLLVLCLHGRLPWPLVMFAALVLALALGSDGLMFSKVRLMLPAFPLLLPPALGLARRGGLTAIVSTTLFVCFGSWFSAYALAVWPYAI